jgi:hypothetical protein
MDLHCAGNRRHYVKRPSGKVIGITVGLGLVLSVAAANLASAAPTGVGGLSQRIETVTTTIPTNQHTTVEASCAADEILTGGGYVVASIGPDDKVFANTPAPNNTWHVEIFNDSGFDLLVNVSAVCVSRTGGP